MQTVKGREVLLARDEVLPLLACASWWISRRTSRRSEIALEQVSGDRRGRAARRRWSSTS